MPAVFSLPTDVSAVALRRERYALTREASAPPLAGAGLQEAQHARSSGQCRHRASVLDLPAQGGVDRLTQR